MKPWVKMALLLVFGFGLGLYVSTRPWEKAPTEQTGPTSAPSERGFPSPSTKVFFSPKGGCTKAIVDEIGKAKSSIRFQAYSFTSQEICQALIDAHKRKVDVAGLMDKSNTKEKSALDDLIGGGLDILIDSKHAIAHSKIIVIDESVVITGSFNFTNQAEHANAENLLVLHNKELAAAYIANWNVHKEHSKPK